MPTPTPEAPGRMDAVVSLSKRRGFIFPSSEIYGGINGFWDYGPLGCELKRNVKDAWWKRMVRAREDVVGLDATIIMHPAIWKASGHAEGFADPMVDCKVCRHRFRADQLCEEQGKTLARDAAGALALPEGMVCTACGSGELTVPRAFNLMFKTYVGPVEEEGATAYLRPETAQAIFAQFRNILETSRQSVPFGVAQMGKSFRNEINPRNFTFRSREFEQMELEFFIRPDEAVALIHGHVKHLADQPDLAQPAEDWGWEVWHKYWVEQRLAWYRDIGLPAASLVEFWQPPHELAHYARACVDIQYAFPFGVQELEGIAARGDFDLSQHQQHSGKPLEVFDEPLKLAVTKLDAAAREAFAENTVTEWVARGKEPAAAREFVARLFEGKYLPHVIEPSAGVDRLALALLCNAYEEQSLTDDKGKQDIRTVLHFHPAIAPVKVAVFPLVKNKPELYAHARGIFAQLQRRWPCFWDASGAIGRRYRRQDEAGTPFCVTVDFQALEDGTVTLRDRDTMRQERLSVPALIEKIDQLLL